MEASEVAGVVPQSNWNIAYGNSGFVSALVDDAGNGTNASVRWASPNMYFTPIPDLPGNNRLMKGYQDTSNIIPTAVEVKDIPRSFERYDIYVYFDGGNGGTARAANFRIVTDEADAKTGDHEEGDPGKGFSGCPLGFSNSGTIISGLDAANSDFCGTFIRAAGGSAGNYVLFPNCHGSNFKLLAVHGASADGQYRAPVNGIQIVSASNEKEKEY
jgi:hypothetical protein